MTFLELLLKILPERGGWPEGADECYWHRDESTITFYDKEGNTPKGYIDNWENGLTTGVKYEGDVLGQSVTYHQWDFHTRKK